MASQKADALMAGGVQSLSPTHPFPKASTRRIQGRLPQPYDLSTLCHDDANSSYYYTILMIHFNESYYCTIRMIHTAE